jgi:cell division protein FtsI/penicillin-binding protein 2
LSSAGLAAISKTGTTQVRVYFNLDDNDDGGNDYIGYYSGEASSGNRPQLVVTYQ